jgi:transposase
MQQSAPEEFGAYIGIDWADQTHFVSLRDANSQEVKRYKLEQKPEVLLQWVNELQQRFPGQRVAVALEQTRGALIYALMSYEFFVLFPVNPKALARYREAFNVGGAKDDPTDSDLLLELVMLHRSKLRAWRPDDELTRTITLLVQYRRDLVDMRTALTHRLAALLKLYFPQALQWAGKLDTFQACDFLQRWPTLAKVQRTPAAKLRQFYVSHNCRTVAVIENDCNKYQQLSR